MGGGITSALMAYRLIKEGKSVCLIDKSSASDSIAMLQYDIDVPLQK